MGNKVPAKAEADAMPEGGAFVCSTSDCMSTAVYAFVFFCCCFALSRAMTPVFFPELAKQLQAKGKGAFSYWDLSVCGTVVGVVSGRGCRCARAHAHPRSRTRITRAHARARARARTHTYPFG